MQTIRVAMAGLGHRGQGNLSTVMNLPGIEITALCDLYPDRCETAVEKVRKAGGDPFVTQDYREIMDRDDVDAVLVCSSWESHIAIAIAAMEAGHAVGMEVGGAADLSECFALVEAWEKTRVPFMFLENCCFGKNELLVLNMVKAGLFGEIVHCHGAYAHDLREEVSGGKENRHYRLHHYLTRNCENYPTHELGPIAKVLNINRGNRMVRLVSVSSKAAGLSRYVKDRADTIKNRDLLDATFAQGDIVNTLITCAGGETISLRLDTTLPRSYSREFTVRGTKGMYEENTNSVFLDGEPESFDTNVYYRENYDSARRFEAEYLPDCWKNVTKETLEAGHGGMDVFSFQTFFQALRTGAPMPIDVYDAAAWMSISCLSEQSIAGGNIPVEIPDFTHGAWKTRAPLDVI